MAIKNSNGIVNGKQTNIKQEPKEMCQNRQTQKHRKNKYH